MINPTLQMIKFGAQAPAAAVRVLVENHLQEEKLKEQILRCSAECARLIAEIDQVLYALEGKRRTLEEKAIIAYFCRCVHAYTVIISSFHNVVEQPENGETRSALDALLKEFSILNGEVDHEVSEFLKAYRFNVNYLEQYFEYDFNIRLLQNCLFADRLEDLRSRLELARNGNSSNDHKIN